MRLPLFVIFGHGERSGDQAAPSPAAPTWTLAGLDHKVVRAVSLQISHASGVTPYVLTASDQPGYVCQRVIQDAP